MGPLWNSYFDLSENFLDEYEKHCPVSRQQVALWEALDILMLVLHGWIKAKVGELSGIIYLLERFCRRRSLSDECCLSIVL